MVLQKYADVKQFIFQTNTRSSNKHFSAFLY